MSPYIDEDGNEEISKRKPSREAVTSVAKPDPVDHIEWRRASSLRANGWNPNRVYKSEMKLLEFSIMETGWMQPLLINPDGVIIDGFHRWRLAQDSQKVKSRWQGLVPVAIIDVQEDEAMAITVRINRAKGTHVAVELHRLVHTLATQYDWSIERIASSIGGTRHEVETLAQEGIFAIKKIAKWKYSPAWYPIESYGKTDEERAEEKALEFEREEDGSTEG